MRLGADDLHRVLVGAHRPVGAEAEEDRSQVGGRLDVERRVIREARPGDVIGDADGEAPLGPLPAELLEDPGGHSRRELLRGQPVTTADHEGHDIALCVCVRLGKGGDDVEKERLPE